MATIRIPQERVRELPEFKLYSENHPAFNGARATPLAREHMAEMLQFESSAVNTDQAIARQIDVIREIFRTKAEQVIGNAIWEGKKPATTSEWHEAPRTNVKTVQDIFCDEVDRIAFQRDELQTREQRAAAVNGTIFDPRRINDTLLINLGLGKYVPGKRTKRLPALLQRAEAIPEIKNMMANLQPFIHAHEQDEAQLHYFRLMRIANGKNDGFILGTQHANNGKKILFKTDIYGAQRRLIHIQQQYGGEIEILKTMQGMLQKVHSDLVRWNTIRDTDAIQALLEMLTECVNKLEFVEKPEKVKMREQIKKALTIRYKSGRQNPGAMRACLATAIESLGRRTAEMEHIHGYLEKDQIRLQGKIAEEQIPTTGFLAQVERHHLELRILRPAQQPLTVKERQKIIDNLRNLEEQTKTMQTQPNLMFGKKYQILLDQLIYGLETYDEQDQEKHETLRKQFVKLYALGKMHRAAIDLKRVHYAVSVNTKIYDPKDLVAQLEAIKAQIQQSRIAQDVATPEMRDPYIAVYDHLRDLIEEAKKSLEGKDPSSEQKLVEPTVTELLMRKIQGNSMLRRMFEALKIQQKRPTQQPLPFTVDKQETAKIIKEKLIKFNWEAVLASV